VQVLFQWNDLNVKIEKHLYHTFWCIPCLGKTGKKGYTIRKRCGEFVVMANCFSAISKLDYPKR